MHIEFLLEEESCAAALQILVPRLIGNQITFKLHTFQGKPDLLRALPNRLRAYKQWIPSDWRIVVLLDRDEDDCLKLKLRMEKAAIAAKFTTPSTRGTNDNFQILNRIAVEELEAWFFGDVEALAKAYPKIPATLAAKRGFRVPDGISGGTWEALERLLQRAGYYRAGMPKVEVARNVAAHMEPSRTKSHSFKIFCRGIQNMLPVSVPMG